MRTQLLCAAAILALLGNASGAWAQAAHAKTHKQSKQVINSAIDPQDRLSFVIKYIHGVYEIETVRVSAEQDLVSQKNAKVNESFYAGIYTAKQMQLALNTQINILKGERLDAPFETLVLSTIKIYEYEVNLYQKVIDMDSAFIAGPKPGVDYGKLAAEQPQIVAELDYAKDTLFKTAPLYFYALLDMKRTDAQDNACFLLITKSERAQLLDEINTDFGTKIDLQDQSYAVNIAQVLKTGLNKYKASDEP